MYGGEAITVGMVTAMHRFEDNGMINRNDDLLCKTARQMNLPAGGLVLNVSGASKSLTRNFPALVGQLQTRYLI
jgi:hypothetical protein